MALSFELKTTDDISFGDFLDFTTKTIKKEDEESLLQCVECLQRLSNNRTFLAEFINQQLAEYTKYQANNSYSAQTLMLYNHPFFYVRANAWEELAATEIAIKTQEELFFFLRAHDHNFSFLTVGYQGPGYVTDIWEYDRDSVIGYAGEPVDLSFLERTTLPQGKAMLYRCSKDVHAQHPPEEYSVSINIILNSFSTLKQEQFYFSPYEQKIAGIVPSGGTGKHLILELAKKFYNDNTTDLVNRIAQTHQIPYVRAKAFDVLAELTTEPIPVWNAALKDASTIVSGHAKMILNNIS